MRRWSIASSAVAAFVAACSVAPDRGSPPVAAPVAVEVSPIVQPRGTLATASKVDLLLVIDDSASMADKQALLARSIPELVSRVAAEVDDIHVGVVTTSLGGRGGDVCPDEGETNRRAHLVKSAVVPDGVLRFARGGDAAQLAARVADLVVGVGQRGCGIEAQLEAMYRFLVEPDPVAAWVSDDAGRAVADGLDEDLLRDRRAFLRPDSLVSVVLLTDEDDATVDPYALRGQGAAYVSSQFPGSPVVRPDGVTTTAPRATPACAVDTRDPACTSCALAAQEPACAGDGMWHGAADDSLNTRFARMKRRFGVDPRMPLSRYVQGLLSARVPSRGNAHDEGGRYVGAPTCTNPLYAAALPAAAGDELCTLADGPRSDRLVIFTAIAGAPPALVGPEMTGDAWSRLLGRDPEADDLAGIDAAMTPTLAAGGNDLEYACTFQLETPRAASPDCDPFGGSRSICDGTVQVAAKAYPSLRPFEVARRLGDHAVAASICPAPDLVDMGGEPLLYRPAMTRLADRMSRVLAR